MRSEDSGAQRKEQKAQRVSKAGWQSPNEDQERDNKNLEGQLVQSCPG